MHRFRSSFCCYWCVYPCQWQVLWHWLHQVWTYFLTWIFLMKEEDMCVVVVTVCFLSCQCPLVGQWCPSGWVKPLCMSCTQQPVACTLAGWCVVSLQSCSPGCHWACLVWPRSSWNGWCWYCLSTILPYRDLLGRADSYNQFGKNHLGVILRVDSVHTPRTRADQRGDNNNFSGQEWSAAAFIRGRHTSHLAMTEHTHICYRKYDIPIPEKKVK